MTVSLLAQKLGLRVITPASTEREITSVYCCDLLSLAMSRAPADSAWVTVMGNVNTVAVASLGDVACIVLAEGMTADSQALARAQEHGIAILGSDSAIFETAKAIDSLL